MLKCPESGLLTEGWSKHGNFTDYVYPRDCSSQYGFGRKFNRLSRAVLGFCMTANHDFSNKAPAHSNGTAVFMNDGSARWVSREVYRSGSDFNARIKLIEEAN